MDPFLGEGLIWRCLFMTFNNKRDVILVCARLFYWSMRRSFPLYAYDPLSAMLE